MLMPAQARNPPPYCSWVQAFSGPPESAESESGKANTANLTWKGRSKSEVGVGLRFIDLLKDESLLS